MANQRNGVRGGGASALSFLLALASAGIASGSIYFSYVTKTQLVGQDARQQQLEQKLLGQSRLVSEQAERQERFLAEQTRQQGTAALIDSEAMVWTLEGQALREAQVVLASDDARQLLGAGSLPEAEREQRLRTFLRGKRSKSLSTEAGIFLESLNSASRRFLAEQSAASKMQPEELVLEWITYEAALDFGMMTRVWQQQGNFKGDAARVAASFIEGMSEPPAVEKGVSVQTRSSNRIVINLFGARVVEEVIAGSKPDVDASASLVRWKSNYNYLREVLNGKSPPAVIEEKMVREEGRFVVDYLDWFKEYLSVGNRQSWAKHMVEGSALAVAAAARDAQMRVNLGKPEPAPRPSLHELFTQLAPAVPFIEAVGGKTGSGFLVKQQGRWLVVTNRHVIEPAPRGVAVSFLRSSGRDPLKILTVPAEKTVVVAIHSSADLAVVDVTKGEADLRTWAIEPVTLAPVSHTPEVGEHAFAIGHPTAGDDGSVLSRTLSDGIVSAVGRQVKNNRCIQMTVPINPGNSGGPLFDDQGRVVGVNTFMIRKNESAGLALEALNFALEIDYVHEVLTDRGKGLNGTALAAVLKPGESSREVPASLASEQRALVDSFTSRGFRPLQAAAPGPMQVVSIPVNGRSDFSLCCLKEKTYAVGLAAPGASDHYWAVLAADGTIVASHTGDQPQNSVVFQPRAAAQYTVVIPNPATSPKEAVVVFFEK